MLLLGLFLFSAVAHLYYPKGQFLIDVGCSKNGTYVTLDSEEDTGFVALTTELIARAWNLAGVVDCLKLGGQPTVYFMSKYLANTYGDKFIFGAHPRLGPFCVMMYKPNRRGFIEEDFSKYVIESEGPDASEDLDLYVYGHVGEFEPGYPPHVAGSLINLANYRLVTFAFQSQPPGFVFEWIEFDPETNEEWVLGLRNELHHYTLPGLRLQRG